MHEDVTLVQVHNDEAVVFGVVEELQPACVSPLGRFNGAGHWGLVGLGGVVVVDWLDDWTLRLHLGDGAFSGRMGHYWDLNVLGVAHVVF